MIGNDVIDLNFADSPPREHIGHLQRACTQVELAAIRASPYPSRAFAVVWASKEAAFKLLSGRINHCSFAPKQFETNFTADAAGKTMAKLTVRFAHELANVTIASNENWVHAVAVAQEGCSVRWKVREIPACSGSGAEVNRESAAARLLARELFSEGGLEDAILEFHRNAPVVHSPARRLDQVGISLSHHGRYAAAAIAMPMSERARFLGSNGKSPDALEEGMCSTCIA